MNMTHATGKTAHCESLNYTYPWENFCKPPCSSVSSVVQFPEDPMASEPNWALDFTLPPELEASEPPEARGLARDEVRLMVSYRADDRVVHTRFRDLASFLEAGDLLVINTSGTMNAALPATRADGTALELHLSTHLPADLWSVEARLPDGPATRPFRDIVAGEVLSLPGGATATLHVPYISNRHTPAPDAFDRDVPAPHPARLWIATLRLPSPLDTYLAQHGFPIRYGYTKQRWPLSYYQTVYTTETGSAEMPSAGRAFTPELITRLISQGVQVAPLLLHTGVASLEEHEPPYEEYYRVPAATARLVNAAHAAGGRVIAVGTTVVRALETMTDTNGTTHPGAGWTSLVVTPERGIRAIDGLLTGLHEPRASHLAMLAALAGVEHLRITYAEALRERYLWHEFGDLHLILP
jgi:S-adenosylmethionine:tRNA ribosyltransferase-isomerase